MPSNLGPKSKFKMLKIAQRSARSAFKDFRPTLRSQAVQRAFTPRFIYFVNI